MSNGFNSSGFIVALVFIILFIWLIVLSTTSCDCNSNCDSCN